MVSGSQYFLPSKSLLFQSWIHKFGSCILAVRIELHILVHEGLPM